MCNYVKIKRTSLFVILSLILSCSKKKAELCPENYLEIRGGLNFNLRLSQPSGPIQFIEKLEKGRPEEIKKILKEGRWKISGKIPNRKDKTPLHVAAEAGNREVVEFLINDSAKIDVKDKQGYTPLHGAAENGHKEIGGLLLQKMADIIEAKDEKGHTPLHVAALYGKEEVVEELLKYHPDIKTKDNDGDTPLHLATLFPSKEVLELLLKAAAQVNAVNKWKETPLHLACYKNHVEGVKLLLKDSADVTKKNKEGYTPLQWATKLGKKEVACFFLDKYENVAKEDNTLLRLAVLSRNEQIVNALIRHGADVMATDQDGNIPLHEAARSGNEQIAQLLIDENNESVKQKNRLDETPLHYAAAGGHIEVIARLCKKGAGVDAKDNSGNTPLHRAASVLLENEKLFKEVWQCLIKHGGSIDVIYIKNNSGETPIEYSKGYRDIADIGNLTNGVLFN